MDFNSVSHLVYLVIAAWAFAKVQMDGYPNKSWFGKFLTNWNKAGISSIKGKYAMILVMASTLAFTWFGTGNAKAVLYSGVFMAGVAVVMQVVLKNIQGELKQEKEWHG